MGKKLANAPVFFALIQARFNAVLTLDQYIPVIQENLRKSGYPDFQKQFFTSINFNLGNQQGAEQQPAAPTSAFSIPTAKYLFMDAAKTSNFILEVNSLTYQTTHYDTFDPFLNGFLRGLELVHKQADLSFIERLGVRFLDAVVPQDDGGVSKMLKPYMLGLFGKLTDRELVHSVSETRTRAGTSSLISRLFIYKHLAGNPNLAVAFPPDLAAEPLKLMDKFTKLTGTYGILDNDCFNEDRDEFDFKKIEGTVRRLHGEISRSFDLMVTPDALKIWE